MVPGAPSVAVGAVHQRGRAYYWHRETQACCLVEPAEGVKDEREEGDGDFAKYCQ